VRRLGPYQLLDKIGTGGMAEVWVARKSGAASGHDRDSSNAGLVAIKLLASHLAERREYRDMFLAEARLSMQLSHPNIVRVFDAVAHEADCYMVMELITGLTLSQLERSLAREGDKLSTPAAVYVVAELLRALAYAHQVRTAEGSVIVHRDVSPQNVMVTSAGQVKLMDFGIARFASEETQGAFVKGKLQYMPPEQLRKQTRKPTVDLYAVGAILHELLDGQRFRGRLGQAELIRMVTLGEVPPLREPDAVPAELERVRERLLEPDEAARIQTARTALAMLSRWSGYQTAAPELQAAIARFVPVGPVGPGGPAGPADRLGSKVSSVPEGSFSGVAGLDFGPEDLVSLPSSALELESGFEASFEAGRRSEPEWGGEARSTAGPGTPAATPVASELTTIDEEPEVTSAAQVIAVATPREPRRRYALPLVLGLASAAIGIGVGAWLMFAGAETSGLGAGSQAEPAQVAAAELPPSPRGDAGAEPATDPTDAGADPDPTPAPDPAPTPAPDPGPGELGKPTRRPASERPEAETATPAGRERVAVEFVANEFFFVYVKVGGKVLTLEPRARVELGDGKHVVHLRQSPDQDWLRAGRITLEPGAEYRVEMRKPAGLKLVKK
jgi:eukaryotic-like serine/threonine-protein kinase